MAERNEKGQFVKGKSGNPKGRKAIPQELKGFGKLAPQELYKIATNPKAGLKLRADIWRWFAEMFYGKPKQQQEMEVKGNGVPVTVSFKGDLEKWSE